MWVGGVIPLFAFQQVFASWPRRVSTVMRHGFNAHTEILLFFCLFWKGIRLEEREEKKLRPMMYPAALLTPEQPLGFPLECSSRAKSNWSVSYF